MSKSVSFGQEWKTHLQKAKSYMDDYYHKEPEALKEAALAYKQNPKDFEVVFIYGKALYLLRKFDKAYPLLEQAVKLNPKDPEANAHLAYTYGRLGQGEPMQQLQYQTLAMKYLKTAGKLDPKKGSYHIAWEVGYHFMKMYAAAIKEFQTAISLNPDDPWAYLFAGRTYLATGKKEEAKKVFEKAFSLADKRIKNGVKEDAVPRGIAIYYDEFKMWDDALKYAEIALQWNPKDVQLFPKQSIKALIERIKKEKASGTAIPFKPDDEM